ncbi:hypothetical protein EMIHUDRAFT_235984 [Emiliania huxleyi CCMP1516]|uniref:Secreted protein n=2 Tax=Emiliania huxleyi TaxID=2903 RepID=A0A0D3JV33_EMIH1|nr:hypothetical protein EMIHUDRAFT_235984 [Emiliania huxleyi CCMP1516]EOD27368.1 hypothetical protein EMIHUDRAFT_235984 [Emiliania huxleyi CCMP1516]|eukprot:XP_005779797.1 hypothetical protein EMIHUDRAFT_235984 [Emiliania huxleyi CCMP1516]
MLVASGDGSIMTAGCGACIWSCTCWPAAALSCLCRFFLFASGRLISSSSAAPALQLTSGASHQPAPPGRRTRHERPSDGSGAKLSSGQLMPQLLLPCFFA